MIQAAILSAIKAASPGISEPIFYGTASGAPPYYVMLKLPGDTEQPETVCQSQGGQGRVTLQFTAVSENTAAQTEALLEMLKDVVKDIIGNIVYNSDTYNVWKNETGGVASLGGADNNTWDAVFESTIWWEKL